MQRGKEKKILIFILCLFASLPLCIFSSCAKPPPQTSLNLENRNHAETLGAQLSRQNELHSLSAYIQFSVDAKGKHQSMNAALLISAPNKLRIEILDDLGQLHSRLIADGSQVLWYDADEDSYALISQQDQAMKKILQLPISIEEFIQRMLLKYSPSETTGVTENSESLEIERTSDRLTLNLKPLVLKAFAKKKDSAKKKNLYEIKYNNYTSQDRFTYPQEIIWQFQKPKVKMTLQMKDLALNQKMADSKFNSTPPPGVEVGKIH